MNIVAIGGGEIRLGETELFDRTLVSLGGPKLLFLPTASDDNESYIESVEQAYGRLGCEVSALRLYGRDGDPITAAERIAEADVVYVGGGNTKSMLERWRALGVDTALHRHLRQGKPAGGISAGAICWFRAGNSDCPVFEGVPNLRTARLDAMGLVDLVLCPHCSREEHRLDDFRAMMRTETGVGIGLDDGCAIQIRGDRYRILSSLPGATAHRIEWIEDTLTEHLLPSTAAFHPLSDI